MEQERIALPSGKVFAIYSHKRGYCVSCSYRTKSPLNLRCHTGKSGMYFVEDNAADAHDGQVKPKDSKTNEDCCVF